MSKKLKGFISILNVENFPISSPFWKLSLLWFDNLILDANPESVQKSINQGIDVEHWSKLVQDEISVFWESVYEYFDDQFPSGSTAGFSLADRSVPEIIAKDVLLDLSPSLLKRGRAIWGEMGSLIEERRLGSVVIRDHLRKNYNFDAFELVGEKATQEIYPDLFICLVADMLDHIGEILGTWYFLNLSRGFVCSLIPSKVEADVFKTIVQNQQNSEGFSTFCKVAEYRVPTLNKMKWERVVELRHHKYLEAFRKKLGYIHQLSGEREKEALIDIFEEIERKDLYEIAKLCKPHVSGSVVECVLSNLPGLIFNPFSAATAAAKVMKEYKLSKKYGWLLFFQDFIVS